MTGIALVLAVLVALVSIPISLILSNDATAQENNLTVFTESGEYKSGDTVQIHSTLNDPIRTAADFVALQVYNAEGDITIDEQIASETGEFSYEYIIGGPLDDESGTYRIEATFGPETSEWTFVYTAIEGYSNGWLPLTVQVDGKTYSAKYKLDNLVLDDFTVDPESSTATAIIEPGSEGRESKLILRYPKEMIPFEVAEVFNDKQCARFDIVGVDEKTLTIHTYAYNNVPTEVTIFANRLSCDYVFVPVISVNSLHGEVIGGKLETSVCYYCPSSPLMLMAEITDHGSLNAQAFVIFEVREAATGYSAFIEVKKTALISDSIVVGVPWIPDTKGEYQLRAIVVDDLENIGTIDSTGPVSILII